MWLWHACLPFLTLLASSNGLGASASRPGTISQLLTSDCFREGCQGSRALMASSEARALGLIMSWNSALCKPGWMPVSKPEYQDVCANSQGTSQPIGCSALTKALSGFQFSMKKGESKLQSATVSGPGFQTLLLEAANGWRRKKFSPARTLSASQCSFSRQCSLCQWQCWHYAQFSLDPFWAFVYAPCFHTCF